MMTPSTGVKCYSFYIHHMLYANEVILFTRLGGKTHKIVPVVYIVNQV